MSPVEDTSDLPFPFGELSRKITPVSAVLAAVFGG